MESLPIELAKNLPPTIAGILLCWLCWKLNRESASTRQLAEKINFLEREKIQGIEQRLDQHLKEDKSQELLTEMKHVNGNLEKLTAQVSRALETNAGQSRDIENNKQYIENLRQDLQSHVRECAGRKLP